MTVTSNALMTKGLVIASYSNNYEVLVDGVVYCCVLKGLNKKSGQSVLVGDEVCVDNIDMANHLGRITVIAERKNSLNKPKIANVMSMVAMVSVASPAFDPLQLDRYVTQGLLAGLNVVIVLSKMDLCPKDLDIQYYQNLYAQIGFPVATMSIAEPDSITTCLKMVEGNTVVMAGLSGVGKSSFLNRIRPELNLKVGDVSHKLSRGAHTTRHVSLIQVSDNTFIADTPGFSQLNFDTVMPSILKKAFPEFEQFNCHYPDCDHVIYDNNIPSGLPEGCYLEQNPTAISPSRLASYQTFLIESKQFEAQQKISSQKIEGGFKTLDKTQGKKSDQLRLTLKQRGNSRRVENQKKIDWTETEEELI